MRSHQEEGRTEEIAFKDQDFAFDEELQKTGTVVKELKHPPERRVVKAYLTDEEKGWVKKKDPVCKQKLLKS